MVVLALEAEAVVLLVSYLVSLLAVAGEALVVLAVTVETVLLV